jgi:spore germination protein
VLASFYQASEDYYQRWEIMSFVRIIRYIAGFFAFALPGLYAAVTLYQPSMIAGELAFKLAGARTTVPIPTIAELIFMELAFEALREAGIRLPSAIGSTLGIVGGIIIGQAAVDAGLVSPMVVIVVALTGICSFAVPNISLTSAYRLVKYFIILLSAVLGLYGWFIGIIAVLVHLCSLKSFGIPYIYPFAAASNISELKDSFIRAPLRKMKTSIFSRKRGDSDE